MAGSPLGCSGKGSPSKAGADASGGGGTGGGGGQAGSDTSSAATDGQSDAAAEMPADGTDAAPDMPAAHADAATDGSSDGAASSGDGSSSSDGAPSSDASHATVPMFVAVGSHFRRIISCDDGLTWVGDQADTSGAQDEWTGARGLAYGDGLFVAAIGGGGKTGRVFSTNDGVTWTERVPIGVYNGFSQVAYGAGYYVAGGGNVSIRSRTGTSDWGELASMGDGGILRHLAFGGGKFVAVGGGRLQQSADGKTWADPASGMCAGEVVDIVFGNGRFLAVNSTGVTCLSSDGGMTWMNGNVGGIGVRGLVWTGHDFLARSPDKTYRSPDGVTWTNTTTSTIGPDLMAVSDHGTLAGIAGGAFFRSTDGTTWTKIAVTTGDPNIGFTRLVFGHGSPSTVCPGP